MLKSSVARFGAAAALVLFLALPLTAQAQEPININTATAAQLQTLPGIGEVKAQAIVEHRSQHGPFTSVDQLTDVHGVGAATLANIRSLITVGDGAQTTGGDDSTDTSGGSEDSTGPPADTSGLINVNTADAATLQTLPGIGPAKASAIIDYRTQYGAFTSVDQLTDVPGIGTATLGSIRSLVTVE
jgi:competence protein ComEA